jgi:hypothetical protein
MASASMGSVFLCLLASLLPPSSFCPSSVFRESLGHSLSLGAPLLPLPSGAPLLPRHPGATSGRRFPPSLFGRGMMVPIHHPSRGSSRRTGRGPEALPPSSGRPRRGGAAPAFVGASNSSPSAPRALAPGTGNTVTANPSGPVSHEAGRLTSLCLCREEQVLRFNTLIKTNKGLSHYINVQIGRI